MLFQKKRQKKRNFAASFDSVQLPNTRNALFKFSLRYIIVLNYYTTGNLQVPFHAVSLRSCVAACNIIIHSVFQAKKKQKTKQWINREMHPEQPFSSTDCFKYPIISPIFCNFFNFLFLWTIRSRVLLMALNTASRNITNGIVSAYSSNRSPLQVCVYAYIKLHINFYRPPWLALGCCSDRARL